MTYLKGALLAGVLLLITAPSSYAQVTCPASQSTPNFTSGGSVFGRTAPQWNTYSGVKVDATNGCLTNPTIINPMVTGLSIGSFNLAPSSVAANPNSLTGPMSAVPLGLGLKFSAGALAFDPAAPAITPTGGSTASSAADLTNRIISVKDFGAKCDVGYLTSSLFTDPQANYVLNYGFTVSGTTLTLASGSFLNDPLNSIGKVMDVAIPGMTPITGATLATTMAITSATTATLGANAAGSTKIFTLGIENHAFNGGTAGSGWKPGDTFTVTGGTRSGSDDATVGIVRYTHVAGIAISAAGSGGTNGTYTVFGTSGNGNRWVGTLTVAGGAGTAIVLRNDNNSQAIGGRYSTNPDGNIASPIEPVAASAQYATGGAFTSGVTTAITMANTAPLWATTSAIAGTSVYDLTTGQQVGSISSWSGTTLTLQAAASSTGSLGDVLAFVPPSGATTGINLPTGLTVALTMDVLIASPLTADGGTPGLYTNGGYPTNPVSVTTGGSGTGTTFDLTGAYNNGGLAYGTDDTAALNIALNPASNAGWQPNQSAVTIMMPPRPCGVTGTLTIAGAGVHVVGQGTNWQTESPPVGSALQPLAAITGPMVLLAGSDATHSASDNSITHLTLMGSVPNPIDSGYEVPIAATGIETYNENNFTLAHLGFDEFYTRDILLTGAPSGGVQSSIHGVIDNISMWHPLPSDGEGIRCTGTGSGDCDFNVFSNLSGNYLSAPLLRMVSTDSDIIAGNNQFIPRPGLIPGTYGLDVSGAIYGSTEANEDLDLVSNGMLATTVAVRGPESNQVPPTAIQFLSGRSSNNGIPQINCPVGLGSGVITNHPGGQGGTYPCGALAGGWSIQPVIGNAHAIANSMAVLTAQWLGTSTMLTENSADGYNDTFISGSNVLGALRDTGAGYFDLASVLGGTNEVEVSAGLNNTALGQTTPAAGAFTTLKANGTIATGSAPTAMGTCPINTQVGGNTAGTFAANGACASGTVILTFATTAPHGWVCNATDQTTGADTMKQTASSATSCTLTGTMASADVVGFQATGF